VRLCANLLRFDLAIATIILAVIAARQSHILETTDASTRKAADAAVKSADAAVKSADTANAALNAARENFQIEQRPVVWLTNDLGAPQFIHAPNDTGVGQIAWAWHYTNYGKTPALHMSFHSFMRIEHNNEESYGVVGPSTAAPLPTNKIDFSSVVSRPGIGSDEFNRLLATDDAVGISGDLTYFDKYGHQYETTFCLTYLRSSAIGYCKKGNDIK
jgi:hypothetical protein